MYTILKRNAERIRIFLMIVLVVLCVVCLCVFWGDEDQFRKDLCYEIITGVMFTTLTICFISIFNWLVGQKEMDDAYERKISKHLVDLLCGHNIKDNLISSLYSEESARQIMKNSVSYFNDILCDSYCAMIEYKNPVIRENFDYRVKIFKSPETGKVEIGQYLEYKRHFRITDKNRSDSYVLKCGFAFSKEVLSDILADNSFFMREEIADEQLIKDLSNAIVKLEESPNAISNLLKLRISLMSGNKEKEISPNGYCVEPITDNKGAVKGVVVKVGIPSTPDYIKENNGMVCYTGRVKFRIPIEKNSFDCVFADPIIGTTSFSIEFGQDLIDDIDNSVEFLPLLTIANRNNVIVSMPDKYQKEFRTSETILPISGIVVVWPDTSNCNKTHQMRESEHCPTR